MNRKQIAALLLAMLLLLALAACGKDTPSEDGKPSGAYTSENSEAIITFKGDKFVMTLPATDMGFSEGGGTISINGTFLQDDFDIYYRVDGEALRKTLDPVCDLMFKETGMSEQYDEVHLEAAKQAVLDETVKAYATGELDGYYDNVSESVTFEGEVFYRK